MDLMEQEIRATNEVKRAYVSLTFLFGELELRFVITVVTRKLLVPNNNLVLFIKTIDMCRSYVHVITLCYLSVSYQHH